jgi:uncharacterized 2Fe-2S/4Fe-4S cluster protein (DUF4445 family)
MGDLVIDVPPESQVHKQVVRKEADTRAIELDPAHACASSRSKSPTCTSRRRISSASTRRFKDQWQIDNVTCDLSIISDLQKALRKGEWKITAAVYSRAPGGGNRLVSIWPGFHDKAFGIAIDVGSTTIAAHLTNLSTGEVTASAGLMNPQIRFGEDLMSRVSYVMMNPGGEKEMTVAIRQALNTLAQEVASQGQDRTPTFWKWCWSAIPSCITCSSGSTRQSLAARPLHSQPGFPSPARARTRPQAQPRRMGLCAALHRGPCGCRHRRRRALRSAA